MIVIVEKLKFDVEYTYYSGCVATHIDPPEEPIFELTSVKLNGVEIINFLDSVGGLHTFNQLAYDAFRDSKAE